MSFYTSLLEARASSVSRYADAHEPLQYGGLDNYLLKTKPDLLGWEGMRLRTMVRDKRLKVLKEEQRQKALLERQLKSPKRKPATPRAA